MRFYISAIILLFSSILFCQTQKVKINSNNNGFSLTVDDSPFFIEGMNWDYYPIGKNYDYKIWEQDEDFIKRVLEYEMGMLRDMGVNAIRQYVGIPKKWISYIYENYEIYTVLNHAFGRYGVQANGRWHKHTDYHSESMQQSLLDEIKTLAEDYRDTPGLLMYLLGNENNYGLFWEGAETEDIPSNTSAKEYQALALYKLFNEASLIIKSIDTNHPVAICNGDLVYIDMINKYCKDVDIFGTNIYRGVSFGDAFACVKEKLNMPILFTEFGADAFNAVTDQEDQSYQAEVFLKNWEEIYINASGMGGADNSIGGLSFQFSDGWWKYGQTKNLDVHNTQANWANGGYKSDYIKGKNNMNEEWFGVCAKEPSPVINEYKLKPRAAYYAIKEAHKLDLYQHPATQNAIRIHFSKIKIESNKKEMAQKAN